MSLLFRVWRVVALHFGFPPKDRRTKCGHADARTPGRSDELGSGLRTESRFHNPAITRFRTFTLVAAVGAFPWVSVAFGRAVVEIFSSRVEVLSSAPGVGSWMLTYGAVPVSAEIAALRRFSPDSIHSIDRFEVVDLRQRPILIVKSALTSCADLDGRKVCLSSWLELLRPTPECLLTPAGEGKLRFACRANGRVTFVGLAVQRPSFENDSVVLTVSRSDTSWVWLGNVWLDLEASHA